MNLSPLPSLESCAACKFFRAHPARPENLKAPPQGLCLRYPPSVHPMEAGGGQVAFMGVNPTVPAVHTCGEWQMRAPERVRGAAQAIPPAGGN